MNPNIKKLSDKGLLSKEQQTTIRDYFSLAIFSVRNELLFLMYLCVLLFTSGVGILIYKNIDTIGHTIILLLLFVLIVGCYYFCFKKSKGFTIQDIDFDNPIYNYLVLLATILSCTFMGYLQYQYHIFGKQFEISILISAFIAFGTAYYFNNKSALSIGLTALSASIGIILTPQTLIDNEVYWNENLSYYGLILGLMIVLWATYSQRINLKKHFDLILTTFALHLMSICCIAGLINDYWFVFIFILAGSSYYFYIKSFKIPAISIYVFTILYAYIGFNIFIARLTDELGIFDSLLSFFILLPFYFFGSIVLFIMAIKKFNKKTNDSL
jgi:Predicted membrane protein (DUF2157)